MFDLPTGWRWSTVEAIAAADRYACVGGPFGSNLTSRHYVDAPGVPVVRGQNMGDQDRRFVDDGFVYVSQEKADSLVQNMAYPGDLIFTQRGTLGQVAWIPRDVQFPRYVVSQSQMKLTVDENKASAGFMYAYFRSRPALDYISRNAIATGVPHINLGILRSFPVPLPPLDEQRRIAAVLGALDDKIELNRKMNRTLEEMAQAIFKSWFIDFDGHDDLVDSEIGPVPRGWEVGGLSSFVELNPRLSMKRGTEAIYVEMKALPTSGPSVSDWTTREYKGGARFQQNDTLLARITPCLENGKSALVDFLDEGQIAFGSTEYIVLRPRPGVPRVWPYCLVRFEPFRAHAIANMTGSSGRQRVAVEALEGFQLAVPPTEVLAEFGAATESLFQRITTNVNESRTLAALRDTLLPKLISGELRVPEAEELVGAPLG